MAKERSSVRQADSSAPPAAGSGRDLKTGECPVVRRAGRAGGDDDSAAASLAAGDSIPREAQGHQGNTDIQDDLLIEEVGVQWIRVRWTMTRKTLDRADSAMGREAHRCSRALRVLQIEHDDSGPRSKKLVQEITLPGNASEWFVHLPSSEHAWIIEIGTLFGQGRFFSMLHSAPLALRGTRAPLAESRKYLGNERFLESLEEGEPPPLKVQGKFVLNGVTRPGSQATIDDQPVSVCPQTGKFEWELPLANGRIVIPMNVLDCGKIQRALMAIDLNFHLLEPEPGPEY